MMRNKLQFVFLVLLTSLAIWTAFEVKKFSNVRREIAALQADVASLSNVRREIAALQADVASLSNVRREIAALQADVASLSNVRREIIALQADVASNAGALSLLRRAERPVTQLDIKGLAWRVDLLEGRMRDLRAGER
jgi:hypothetical protein